MATAPNTASPFADALVRLLSGAPQFTPPQRPITPTPAHAYPPPMQLPDTAPVPQARPPISMSPAAAPAPAILPAEAPQPAVASAAPPSNPLMALLGGGNKDLRGLVRAFGAGAGNIGNTGGDPFLAFGRGFGGATEHYTIDDALKAKQAAAAEQLSYEREQDAAKLKRDQEKDAQEMEIRRMSEARQAESAKLSNQKTALEIRRLARENGISTKEQLEIERIAQAAGENLDGEERKQAIEETRERLVRQFRENEGLSGAEGLSSSEAKPAAISEGAIVEDADGNQMILRDNQWTPL